MKYEHTPGPWELVPTVHTQRKHIFGRAKNQEYYIGTLVAGSANDIQIFKANTRLIGTAPELLARSEFLQWLLGEFHAGNEFGKDQLWTWLQHVQAVNARARGQA